MVALVKAKESKNISYNLELDKPDGWRQVFRMARQRQKDKRAITDIPYIRGKDGELKITLKEKLEGWKEYEKLLNKQNCWSRALCKTKNEGPSKKVSEEDILYALSQIKTGKANGENGVIANLVKVCGQNKGYGK